MKNIALISLFFSVSVFAQSDTTDHSSKQFLSYYGVQSPNLTRLNPVLNANNYPEFSAHNFAVSLGIVKLSRNLVWSTDFFIYGQSQNKDTLTSSVSTWGIGQSYGYPYLMKKRFQMYTLLGWNYSGTNVKLSKDIASNTPFNTYVSSAGNGLEMTTWSLTANLSTNINFLLNVDKGTNNKTILGLRGGYHFPLYQSAWSMNQTKLKDGPGINPGGYYIMFVLGFTL